MITCELRLEKLPFRGYNGGRPICLGDLILLVDDPIENGTQTVDGLDQPGAVLFHEMVHVWQFNVGGRSYMSKALVFQLFSDDAYDWNQWIEEGWQTMNPEAQAEFLMDAFMDGALDDVPGTPGYGNLIDPAGISRQGEVLNAIAAMRAGKLTI
jgi:hypothetical protein